MGTGITVTVTLEPTNFLDSGDSGFLTNNYELATGATGTFGEITRTLLAVALVPTISKVYDGNTNATLGPTNYIFSGFILSETCTVTKTNGFYASKDVGTGITVTVTLSPTNFSDYGDSGFLTNNYALAGCATGAVGEITRTLLAASLVPTISKVYDGNTNATLGPTNYTFVGLISGETCTVTKTTGFYDSKNVGTLIGVTVTLVSSNFSDYGTSGFLTNNYAPVSYTHLTLPTKRIV